VLSETEETALLRRLHMKVVLLNCPKALAPLLRAMFKIKKMKYED